MTSKEHITQLVDEAVEKRKGSTLEKNDEPQKEKLSYQKMAHQKTISKLALFFCD